jgi:hypothetical protein
MLALVALVGTPAFQLPAVNQSDEIVPVQLVCAREDDAAASNAAAIAICGILKTD